MGFKEIISKLGEKSRERKETIKHLDENLRFQKIVEDRQKSSNERELEKFMKEEREVEIKEALEVMRKKRQEDISFNHNPLNAKNIMKAEWEVMKEKNMFSKKSDMISKGQATVMKNNPNLLKNNQKLFGI